MVASTSRGKRKKYLPELPMLLVENFNSSRLKTGKLNREQYNK
jgi:hypothetical protein